jgi:tRNA pseudouridine38-40 synthase
MLSRWKCTCAYDGTAFAGWQSQAGGGAIQDVIEARLAGMLGAPVRIHGSGRTDAGVHARAQVFHVDAAWRHGPDKLLAAFRTGLPQSIQIKSARPAPAGFHARFSAVGKIYTYDLRLGDADPFTRPYCWTIFRPLDLAAMAATAARLRGRHDFRAFSAGHGAREEDTVRHLRRLEIASRGRRVRITAEADGFLYKMVRNLVGALVAAGQGRLTLEQAERMLSSPARAPRVEAAPPQGLFLDRVCY